MNVLHEFHVQGKFERSLFATFIALLPKKAGVVDIKDFRLISLVGGVYKIIFKVLANWLKIVLEKVISKTQNASIRGRQILDLVFIANECLDSRLKSREPSLLCKLELEKAYDHVKWGLLRYMLRRCGFREKWCEWTVHYISMV